MIILKPFVPTWKAGIVNFLAMFCKTNPATIPGITDCSVPYREGKKKKKRLNPNAVGAGDHWICQS